jgi:predicted NBD/HSP70 family sugar kinase
VVAGEVRTPGSSERRPAVRRRSPGSTASLRPANQRRVLDLLRESASEHESWTQAEITRATGLASGTVSNIVRELATAGVVDTEPGRGRRGTVVRLAQAVGLVAGIDFGHTHVSAAVADLGGRILTETREPLDADSPYDTGLTLAARLLEQLLHQVGRGRTELRSVGIGLPAPITDDVVRTSAILPGWVGVNAAVTAREWFDCPVYVDNDANLGAYGEHRAGVARGVRDVVFVKVSSGVGAGLVLNGRIFHGARGSAGEIGHLTVDESGPPCRCGSRGCLEVYASTGPTLTMMADRLPGATIDDIIGAARGGNMSARRQLEDAALHLGWGLATVVNLLNPGVVVVGGEMAKAGDLLLDAARLSFRRHVLADAAATPIVTSALGERASLVGAVLQAAAKTDILAHPRP